MFNITIHSVIQLFLEITSIDINFCMIDRHVAQSNCNKSIKAETVKYFPTLQSLVLSIYATVLVHCQSHTPFQAQIQWNCCDSKLEPVTTNTQAVKVK